MSRVPKGIRKGSTTAEKILARAAGLASVAARDEIRARPDFVIACDFPGHTNVIFKQMEEEFGIDKVIEPEGFAGLFFAGFAFRHDAVAVAAYSSGRGIAPSGYEV